MEEEVLKTIKKFNMIQENDKIVVAVSGGPDSMTLLNILIGLSKKLNFEVVVAHVNHMIRAVADLETQYVEEFCKSKNIKCFIKKVNVIEIAKSQKISTEEAGRNVRYDFFEEVYTKVNATKIAVAHNANDNAETVLMNIIRGTGVSGLKGIEPVRMQKFIRPLIEIQRTDIEQYCIDMNLNPKFDESNKENIYTRNKIRNLLIPYLQENYNPNIIESINRLSELAAQENDFIELVVEKSFNNVCEEFEEGTITFNLKKFNQLEEFLKSKTILYAIFKIFKTTKGVEKKHIEDIIKLCDKNIGNKYLTPNKSLKISVNKGKIKIEQIKK